jgi:membrane protease YdiL (CAAX protease family)
MLRRIRPYSYPLQDAACYASAAAKAIESFGRNIVLSFRSIFIGPLGLRAGWSVAIFALILAIGLGIRDLILLGSLAPAVGRLPAGASSSPLVFQVMREGSLAILILGATFAMARIEGRSPWSYGLAGAHATRQLVTGFVAGFMLFSTLVGLLVLQNGFVFDGLALKGGSILGFAFYWAVVDFMVGFVEENLFRGYLQYTLARGIGFWPAVLVCSVVFGLAHVPNPGENVVGISAIVLTGVFFSLCLRLTGSLWWVIGFHAALDWVQDFLYGTSNSGNDLLAGHLFATHPAGPSRVSGGADGPEGSLTAVVLVVILNLVAVLLLLRKRRSSTTVLSVT